MLLTAIIAFLVIFSLLILVHEWGHFAFARKFGVKVEEFGLGLPPRARKLWKDRHGTLYSLNWLPLGGFVRMKGEDSHDKKLLMAKDSFSAKSVGKRVVIICAGVAMNLITGYLLLVLIFGIGSTVLIPTEKTAEFLEKQTQSEILSQELRGILVSDILSDGTAKETELNKYDFISAVDGESVASLDGFKNKLAQKPNSTVTLSITRRNYNFELPIKTGADGRIGVAITGPLTAIELRYPWRIAFGEAGKETVRLITAIGGALGDLGSSLIRAKLPEGIGGPVAIAKETFYRASDITALLHFAAMLSITLAIFNILPIPALDGGRLLFLIYEFITRRRPNPRIEANIHAVGFVLLIGLILIISWQDIFG